MPNYNDLLTAYQEAKQAGDLFNERSSCMALGEMLLERNLYSEAAHYFQEAANLSDGATEGQLHTRALNSLGICQTMAGDPGLARKTLEKALAILGDGPDSPLLAAIQGNLGLAYSALQEHQSAIKAHKSVLEVAEKTHDDPLRMNALINLADSNLQNKNYLSAQGFALVALDLAKELDAQAGLVIIYDLLGMISARQGNLKIAAEYHLQSFQAARENGDLLRQGIALANQGLALEGLTELERALEVFSQAEGIFSLLNSDYLDKTRRDLARIRAALAP